MGPHPGRHRGMRGHAAFLVVCLVMSCVGDVESQIDLTKRQPTSELAAAAVT